MANKKRLSGWMRLWIVGCSLWSLLVLLWTGIMLSAQEMSVWHVLGEVLLLWIVPCLFVLALGKAIGWIYLGFDEELKQRIVDPGGESGQPGEPRRNVSLSGAAVSFVRRLFF